MPMKTVGRILCALAVAVALAVPAFAEDLTVVFKTTGQGGEGTATQYYSAEHMRSSDGQTDTIVEYASGTITNIDHEKKEYSQITLAELEGQLRNAADEHARDKILDQLAKARAGLAVTRAEVGKNAREWNLRYAKTMLRSYRELARAGSEGARERG